MKIPLTDFAGLLKQVDASRLDARQRGALTIGFPHFFPNEELDPKPEQIGELVKRFPGFFPSDGYEHPPVTFQAGPNRRFSGGSELPRQRYFTLAHDASGDDDLTLLAELRAYRSIRLGSPCTVLDTIYPPGRACVEAEGLSTDPALLLVFFRDLDMSLGSMGNDLMTIEVDDESNLIEQIVPIPYRVFETRIPGVLDLRHRSAQQWLFETFCVEKGNTHCSPVWDRPDAGFLDMLPFLMTMEVGGGGFTESIGRYLRRHNVSALIYPSARNDCGVIQVNGEIDTTHGWCLVDYRDTEQCDWDLYDLGEQTPLTIGGPVHVRGFLEGIKRGSWFLCGVRQLYRHRFYREIEVVYGVDRSNRLRLAMLAVERGAEEFRQFAVEYGNFVSS